MKKILIISANAVGDTYLSLSAIPALKKIYHDCCITFLCNSASRFLFKFFPVDKIIESNHKNKFDILKILIKLKKTRYDEAYSFFPGRLNSLFLLAANVNRKAGYLNFKENVDWHNNSQKVFLKPPKAKKLYWNPQKNYLDRISLIFDESNISKIRIKEASKEPQVIDSVIIHPFSKDYRRCLLAEQILSISGLFYNKQIYIHGAKDELSLIDFTKLENVKKILVNDNISEFILTLKMNIFISTDSFPLHLADSFNTDFLGLFTHTKPESVLVNIEKSAKFNFDSFDKIDQNSFGETVKTKLKTLGYLGVGQNKNS